MRATSTTAAGANSSSIDGLDEWYEELQGLRGRKAVTSRQSVAVLAQSPMRTGGHEAVPKRGWRAVGQSPKDVTPTAKALHAGAEALAMFGASTDTVHCILCPWPGHLGGQGRSRRRHLQNGINGGHVKTLEVRQDLAGGHISPLLTSRRFDDGSVSMCTGAGNAASNHRCVDTTTVYGQLFCGAVHAIAIWHRGGVAKRFGRATARCPGLAVDWPTCDGSRKATTPDGVDCVYVEPVTGVSIDGMGGAIT